MDLLANDLSVHEQFHDLTGFRQALSGLMALRATAKRFGREIQCHGAFLNTIPIPGMTLQSAIGNLDIESEQRAIMSWLVRSGPFWDDADTRRHSVSDWLECNDEIVTDKALGEAAFRSLHGVKSGLISLTPSEWCQSPLDVTWVCEAEGLPDRNAEIENWWLKEALEASLQNHAPPLCSWDNLCRVSKTRFASLVFAEDCFARLRGIPFAKSAADRLLTLLDILDRLARACDDDGKRTPEGHRIYQDHFTGDKAIFSDSSDSEKQDFRQDMTFVHPEDPARSLFCPWHGKVPHLTLRLHFSWPIKAGKPVYIVYAGRKITRK